MRACDGAYRPITRVPSFYTVLLMLKSGQLIANQIGEFCYSYDYSFYTSMRVGNSVLLGQGGVSRRVKGFFTFFMFS